MKNFKQLAVTELYRSHPAVETFYVDSSFHPRTPCNSQSDFKEGQLHSSLISKSCTTQQVICQATSLRLSFGKRIKCGVPPNLMSFKLGLPGSNRGANSTGSDTEWFPSFCIPTTKEDSWGKWLWVKKRYLKNPIGKRTNCIPNPVVPKGWHLFDPKPNGQAWLSGAKTLPLWIPLEKWSEIRGDHEALQKLWRLST